MGDLALVLHSHMPYVEGFGTYPFGEEWLFDAVIRSYLPVLTCAERLTMTVTPVLADQLEADGVRARLLDFLREYRIGSCRADIADVEAPLKPACEAEASRYERALDQLEADDDLLGLFAGRAAAGRVELIPSTATHAVLPLVATADVRRLQIDAGLGSHRRRFGEPGGFWLAECAYEPGLEDLLAERGIDWFCTDQSAHEDALAALAPIASPGGPDRVHDRLGGDLVAVVARRLSLGSPLRRLSPQVASRSASLGDLRRALPTRGGRGARARASR